MRIFEAIRHDHDIQRRLADRLIATSGESDERRQLYESFKHELQIHADAEERHFYIPLMEVDMSQDKARHSIAEHQEIDELIEKLDETEMSSPAWLTYAKQLHEIVTHHLDEEEHEVFQLAGKALAEKQKEELAKDYKKMMEDNR